MRSKIVNCLAFVSNLILVLGLFSLTYANLKVPATAFSTANTIKSVSEGEYKVKTGSGLVENGVNLLHGEFSYSLPPIGLVTPGGLQFGLNIGYLGDYQNRIGKNSDLFNSGILGVGWQMNLPYVAVENSGTKKISDDIVMVNLGPYGAGQIIKDNVGNFVIDALPSVRVKASYGSVGSKYESQIVAWEFSFPDGNKMVFGSNNNAIRYFYANNEKIISIAPQANMPNSTQKDMSDVKRVIYRWDISSYSSQTSIDEIEFDYDQTFQHIANSSKEHNTNVAVLEDSFQNYFYVSGSFLKSMYWKDAAGKVVDQLDISWGYKPASIIDAQKFKIGQINFNNERIVESISKSSNGKTNLNIDFNYKKEIFNQREYLFLNEANYFGSNNVNLNQYNFEYDPNKKFLLTKTDNGEGVVEKVEYKLEEFGDTYSNQASREVVLLDENRNPVSIKDQSPSSGIEDKDKEFRTHGVECIGEFCFAWLKKVVYTEPSGLNIYGNYSTTQIVNVYRNDGNGFKASPDFIVQKSRNKPANDYYPKNYNTYLIRDGFIIQNGNYFIIYQWNGEAFSENFLDLETINGEGRWREITIYPASSYILIKSQINFDGLEDGAKFYVMKKNENNEWVLDDFSKKCGYANNENYGVSIRDKEYDHCLLFGKILDVVSVSEHGFAIATKAQSSGEKSVINVFSTDGPKIKNITKNIIPFEGASHVLDGYPMTFGHEIKQVFFSDEVLIVETKQSNGLFNSYKYLYDGRSFVGFDYINHTPATSIYLGKSYSNAPGYFIENNHEKGTVYFWSKKVTSSTGQTKFVKEPQLLCDIQGRDPAEYKARVKISDKFIFCETVNAKSRENIDGLDPVFDEYNHSGDDHYLNKLYRILKSNSGEISLEDISSYTPSFSTNFRFSPMSDFVYFEKRYRSVLKDETWCAWVFSCAIEPYMIEVNFEANPDEIFGASKSVPSLSNSDAYDLRYSNVSYLRATANLGSTSERMHIQLSAFDGLGYGTPSPKYVVASKSVVDEASPYSSNSVNFNFSYTGNNVFFGNVYDDMYYNRFSDKPIFEVVKVNKTTNDDDLIETNTYRFSNQGSISESARWKLNSKVQSDANGKTRFSSNNDYSVLKKMNLPSFIDFPYVFRVHNVTYDSKSGWNNSTSEVFHINEFNNQPHFTSTQLGENYLVNQTIFSDQVINGVSYQVPTKKITYNYEKHNPKYEILAHSDMNELLDASKIISFSRTDFHQDIPNFPKDQFVWKDVDQSLDNENLKQGESGEFNVDENLILINSVTKLNHYNQVKESAALRDLSEWGNVFTSIFYSTSRSLPEAIFTNARRENVSVMTGENGPDLSELGGEFTNSWYISPSVDFEAYEVYDGNYSLKVNDNYGLIKKVNLKDVSRGNDLIVSAWINSEEQEFIKLVAERRKDDGSNDGLYLNEFSTSLPKNGVFKPGIWQRYELVIKYEDMIKDGLFSSNDTKDHLRIWVGTGQKQNNSTRIIYVDNIVIYPSDAKFELVNYDRDGKKISTTNNEHIRLSYEYDDFDRIIGIRDDEGKLFSESAFHRIGENVGGF